jgi:molybdopterin biosynthesis enzyme
MLKTISAALLAASVLVAPALAAAPGKTTPAPVVKSENVKPVIKSEKVKPNALNANAKMGRHHVKQVRHHGSHKMSALKTHKVSKATIKHVAPAAKRG